MLSVRPWCLQSIVDAAWVMMTELARLSGEETDDSTARLPVRMASWWGFLALLLAIAFLLGRTLIGPQANYDFKAPPRVYGLRTALIMLAWTINFVTWTGWASIMARIPVMLQDTLSALAQCPPPPPMLPAPLLPPALPSSPWLPPDSPSHATNSSNATMPPQAPVPSPPMVRPPPSAPEAPPAYADHCGNLDLTTAESWLAVLLQMVQQFLLFLSLVLLVGVANVVNRKTILSMVEATPKEDMPTGADGKQVSVNVATGRAPRVSEATTHARPSSSRASWSVSMASVDVTGASDAATASATAR